MKVQEAIDLINNSKEPLYSIFVTDGLIDGDVVKDCQDLDEHRWYSEATRVYKLEDGYIGVRGAYQSFSESQSWSDIGIQCKAFEVEPIPDIYYKEV